MAVLSGKSMPGVPFPPPLIPPRYGTEGNIWTPRRDTGHGGRLEHCSPVKFGRSNHISGYSDDRNGTLVSLHVTNLENGQGSFIGKDKAYEWLSMRELPPFDQSMLVLSHISGVEERRNWSICFHYE